MYQRRPESQGLNYGMEGREASKGIRPMDPVAIDSGNYFLKGKNFQASRQGWRLVEAVITSLEKRDSDGKGDSTATGGTDNRVLFFFLRK